jgi:hypothetical protein
MKLVNAIQTHRDDRWCFCFHVLFQSMPLIFYRITTKKLFVLILASLSFQALSLKILCVPSSKQRKGHFLFYRNRLVKNPVIIMGIGASVSSSQTTEQPSKDIKSKKIVSREATLVKKKFQADLLDASFFNPPVRASTVEASKLYVASSSLDIGPGLMPGTHKHLGGVLDPTDGCIYGVPANSKAVLCIYPTEGKGYQMRAIPLPTRVADCHFKWLRGIIAHGYMWAIPSWADSVLCVDVDAFWGRRALPEGQQIVQLLPLPDAHPTGMIWQWHGAGINKEKNAIYCIPSNAQSVLKVDLMTKTTSLIPIDIDSTKYPNFRLDDTNKWYGGILGDDNAVYGVPYRACAVLRIDCNTDAATMVGPDFGCGLYNWHGGIKVSGKIYAHPCHADTVLVIDTTVDRQGDICTELPIHRAVYDTDPRKNYKWLGGSVGVDGNIYCPACDTSSVLKIDTKNGYCSTLGFAGYEKNKWQGGVLARDGCVYCIPATGKHVLRIATHPSIEGEKPVQLLGDLPVHKDKWQGGAVGRDGALYFIPENGYRVLRIVPPTEPPKIVNGSLPTDDVKIEML